MFILTAGDSSYTLTPLVTVSTIHRTECEFCGFITFNATTGSNGFKLLGGLLA
jgi:hypothetical protein